MSKSTSRAGVCQAKTCRRPVRARVNGSFEFGHTLLSCFAICQDPPNRPDAKEYAGEDRYNDKPRRVRTIRWNVAVLHRFDNGYESLRDADERTECQLPRVNSRRRSRTAPCEVAIRGSQTGRSYPQPHRIVAVPTRRSRSWRPGAQEYRTGSRYGVLSPQSMREADLLTERLGFSYNETASCSC